MERRGWCAAAANPPVTPPIGESGNAEAARIEAELTDTTGRLAALPRQGGLSAAERQSEQASLSDKFDRLQVALAAASADFRKQLDQQHRTADDIRKSLPPGTVLIDLLGYQFYVPPQVKGKRGIWKNHLLAFVVRPGAPVDRVELGPTEPIQTTITQWRQTFGATPLDKYVAGAKTVLISPNSLTAPLSWEVLPGSKPGTFLVDDVAIALVPIPRLLPELLTRGPALKQPEGNPSLLLVGDVDFGADSGDHDSKAFDRVAARAASQFHWPDLPGTRDEVNSIETLFAG